MDITDAQVHLWQLSSPERPWPSPPRPMPPHRPTPFSMHDLISEMDAAGVKRVVIVPPSWEGDYNDLGLEAARLHPDRFAVMGRIDPDAPNGVKTLRGWRLQPGMLGLRFTFALPAQQAALNQDTIEWLWDAAEEIGLPVMMIVTPAQLHFVDDLARRHPDLKLVMDHLALHAGKKGAAAFADIEKLLALAKRPNVAVKASSLPGYSEELYPFRDLHPYLRRVFDYFGPRRVFWGTDLTRLPCSYREAVTMVDEIPWLDAEDKEWFMGRGMCEWLGWKV